MPNRLVSTIIPVFNRPEMLKSAVESVLAQTYRPIEILIADDGSTDETPNVAAQLVSAHPDVIHYRRHENAGPGPSRELGRCMARGEFVQYLDSDDRLLPNKFNDQVAALDEHPECEIAYGVTRLVDRDGAILADPFKWTARVMPELFPGLLVDRWWCTHTPLYRRSLTNEIGSWCDMRWSQDWEYDARIGARRAKLVHCGSHVSEHVHHDGVRQTSSAAWTTDPARLANRVRLLNALWDGAKRAGVPESAPERQHFARWCFSIARQCATQGMKAETDRCLELADESSGTIHAGGKGVGLFRLLTKMIGTRPAGRLARAVETLRSSSSSDATMDQSFSNQVGP
ncbi:GalNAc(5)-diNAcBac-PP-undecaprenol beta-1,3-glucosyltransferase [Stieleria neptunia]|uniref:GalNAc(5)-diNAcBac-PP-undecaprenol beta-1,3-glucosyltransferase n=1 Tax=Stieleria neptunia TaxID=2527979 RepID=A0A518HQL8_9BACT|nr:glycosyltransferase family 2 protein [Stieleria neptunia]QDV43149.1 GalNAc(5)-diNAcBac-PP-undecaprenol beta-1,3-glucosyltransferase [Stieleria neptunia]